MKLFATIWLFLLTFTVFAEEAEKPMETVGMNGILAFLAFCVIGFGMFIYYFRKNAKAVREKKDAGEKKSS